MFLAKRRGSWFRLEKHERVLFSLAVNLRVKFKSFDLDKALVSVLKKMLNVAGSAHDQLRRGMDLAWAFSEAAVKGGYEGAREWRHDWNYIRFLASSLGGG
jgi:hypothetical protein